MNLVSNNHNNIKQPFVLNFETQKQLPQQLTVQFTSDLVFQPRKYSIPHKITKSSNSCYQLQLYFSMLKEESQINDQILNNFGAIAIKQIQYKAPLILVSQKNNIYATLIQNKKQIVNI